MEDYRLPASLVGMLKATRLTGIPRIQTDLQTATLAVTITWELASSTTKKKTTKPPASKKTAPTTKKKKSPSPSTESSEPPKKSTTPPPPPKPTPPPSAKPTPVPSPPKQKPSPKPTPPSPRKASRLQDNVQRLTKVATRRLARQGGLTPEPKSATPQQSAPCPEVLSPQVTARRVGPPPTAVSAVRQPPSPMKIDYRPRHYIPPVPLNYRAKDYLQFLGKGNRQGKVFAVGNNASDIVVQYNRANGQRHYVRFCQPTQSSYVLTASTMYPLNGKQHTISANNCLTAKPESLCHSTRRSSSTTSPRVSSTEPSLRCKQRSAMTYFPVTNQRRPLN